MKLSGKQFVLVAKGFCMGAADVVPGVSGGTMAFILGIYRPLIDAIKSFDLQWLVAITRLRLADAMRRAHLAFLVPLAAGIGMALLFFTRVIPLPRFVENYPETVYGLFFGLIAGSVLVLLQQNRPRRLLDLMFLLAGAGFGILVFNQVPQETPNTTWFIFFSGAVAICAMLLPGVSGSFVLLILKKYVYIFDAIGYFKLAILIPFGFGALAGLIVFSRILSYFIARYLRATTLTITGILLASLWVLWPFQQRSYVLVLGKHRLIDSTPVLPTEIGSDVFNSLLLMVVGVTAVIMINRYAARSEQTPRMP